MLPGHEANPFKAASSCLLPVEIRIQLLRFSLSSAAVMKPQEVGCIFLAASLIFSTLPSEKPLILSNFLEVVAIRLCVELLVIYSEYMQEDAYGDGMYAVVSQLADLRCSDT